MKAMLLKEFGKPLAWEEVPEPKITGPRHVLVQAKANGLVDELGDLNEAIGQASDLAGISEYRIVEYPFVKDPMAILLEQLTGEEDLSGKVAKAAMKEQFGAYAPQVEQLMKYKDMQGIQARLPFVFTYQ